MSILPHLASVGITQNVNINNPYVNITSSCDTILKILSFNILIITNALNFLMQLDDVGLDAIIVLHILQCSAYLTLLFWGITFSHEATIRPYSKIPNSVHTVINCNNQEPCLLWVFSIQPKFHHCTEFTPQFPM